MNSSTHARCKFCHPEKRRLHYLRDRHREKTHRIYLQSLKPYVYQPLKAPSSTRVLKLSLESDKHHLRVQLVEIDLDSDDSPYAALSYTWGASVSPHLVECNCQQIAVTCILYSALLRLREHRLDVSIFVDALCINQGREPEALREREKQVMMMGRIYSQAVRVTVDLGKKADKSILALTFLEKIMSFNASEWEHILVDASVGGSGRRMRIGEIPWEPILDLISRPWFTRVWVIQEFVLAKRLSVMLGMSYLKEDVLTLGMLRFWQIVTKMGYAPRPIDQYHALHSVSIAMRLGKTRKHIQVMMDLRKHLQENGSNSNPLCTAISMSQGFDATDSMDRVYALLGTTSRIEAERIDVNYRDSADRISIQVSGVLIQQGHLLPLLHHLADRTPRSSCSWAVDSEPRGWKLNGLDQQVLPDGTCPQFQACAHTAPGSPRISLDSRSLELSGYLLDKITAVSDYFPEPGEGEESTVIALTAALLDWYDDTFDMVKENVNHDNEGILETSFITALLAGGRLCQNTDNDGDIFQWTGDLSAWVFGVKTFVNSAISGFQGSDEILRSRQFEAGLRIITHACIHRCFAVTETGMLCIAPPGSKAGDVVAVIEGGPIPFLLRAEADYFHLIGSAYVHGIMDGEAVKSENYEITKIILR